MPNDKDLHDRMIEIMEAAFSEIAYQSCLGSKIGWLDTMGSSAACDLGDILVELGKYERHKDGKGRRWFYRPKEVSA